MNEEDELDDEEENVLLQFCFGELYGPNYGVRTIIEFDEIGDCDEEGVDCDSLDEIEVGDEQPLQEEENGN